ncbi:MAG: glutamate 5-kinase [Oligoflexia bacterium]|nr:glutamate 5-kinase [Oligoflexia bacterium]
MKSRWVVKAGSNLVCSGGSLLLRAWMRELAVLRKQHGVEVVWVTSGAIASAVDRTGFGKRDRSLREKQALSAIGQPMIMDLYNIALQASGLLGAQILLTYSDLADAERRDNFRNTVEQLLSWKVTPILNENDAVATEEIKFGDNDSLSARVAKVVKADRLVILTDVDGLYERDPKQDPKAKLISNLPKIAPSLLKELASSEARRKKGGRGTGGIYSKVRAAGEASRHGIDTWLIRGDRPSVLLDVARGKAIGTHVGKAK